MKKGVANKEEGLLWAFEITEREDRIKMSKENEAEMSKYIDAWVKKYSKGFRYVGPTDAGAPASTGASRTLWSLKRRKKRHASPPVNPSGVDWSDDDWKELFRLLEEEHAGVLEPLNESSGASSFSFQSF